MRKVLACVAAILMVLFLCCPVSASDIVYDARSGDGVGRILKGDEALSDYAIRPARRRIASEVNHPGVAAVEFYDFQADALMDSSWTSFHWYPLYSVSMVLAVVDDAPFPVTDWKDLVEKNVTVGIPTDPVSRELSVMALSWGLAGQLKRAPGITMLDQLEEAGRLRLDSTYGETYFNQTRHREKADVYILTDQEARRWMARGRPVHMIMPRSGTLSFRKGLLSRETLPLTDGHLMAPLFRAGYRVSPAGRVLDGEEMESFRQETDGIGGDLKFRVLYNHSLRSLFPYPGYLPYMALLFLTIFWGSSLARRVMGKEAERVIAAMVAVSAAWLFVRTVGLILPVWFLTANRYIWYSYYLFMGLLMPLILFLVLVGDDDAGKGRLPGWARVLAAADVAFSLLVMTNDLHHLVFSFPRGLEGAADIHTYEPGYYLLSGFYFLQLLVSMAALCRRVVRGHVLNRTFFVPVAVLVGYIAYAASYAMGYAVSKSTEFTLVTILAFLLWMETLLDSHMIRANTGYQDFFTYSHLNMQIRDLEGHVMFQSSGLPAAEEDVETRIMPIRGGDVVWYRDVRELREKQRELNLVTQALSRAYALQKKEEDIRRAWARLSTERKTFRELEDIVRGKGRQILRHAAFLRTAKQGHEADESVFRLNVLASYVKKRCVMYLRGEEDHKLDARELRLSIEELFRYLKPGGLHGLLDFEIKGPMPTAAALTLYDFLEELAEDAVIAGELHLVCRVEQKGTRYVLSVLLDPHPWIDVFLNERREDPRFTGEKVTMQLRDLDYAASVEIEVAGGDGQTEARS